MIKELCFMTVKKIKNRVLYFLCSSLLTSQVTFGMDNEDICISLVYPKNPAKQIIINDSQGKEFHNQAIKYYEENQTEEAIKLYKKAGKLGCNESYFNLWQIYRKGEKVEKNTDKAVTYLKKAAGLTHNRVSVLQLNMDGTGGLSDALFDLGILYSKGKYVEQNLKKALWCFKKAADMGHKEAIHKTGRLYLVNFKEVQKAIPYLKKSDELGYSDAQYSLGAIYMSGNTVEKNIPLGIEYLKKAANNNYDEACFLLGRTYKNGYYGFQKDIHLGRRYLKTAANNGYVEACYELGLLDLKVEILPLCLLYLEIAADKKHNKSCIKLGEIYINGKGVIANIPLGIKYLETAADNDDDKALMQLGYLYFDGEKIEKNVQKAFPYFQKAAELGNGLAYVYLGLIYLAFNEQKSPLKDLKKALFCFQRASEMGFEENVRTFLKVTLEELKKDSNN